ncbi:glycosyltransferase family 2 protein [Leptolyngbya sp. KIOST-1]|uniref:glycosyltransferase family 2 protein n=1 Tax=Leptolyngbya sp. KIOST-1 TaxID=1229172 RepID=UPI00056D4BAD|nr:glycosyltransferase [Leptolyngbya sp. KIOST-1]
MSYAIVQLEVTQPLPPVTLTAEHSGVALVLRRRDRLIGQLLREVATPGTISPPQLETWIAESVGPKILQESLQDELQPSSVPLEPPSLTVAICTKDRPDNVARLLNTLVPLQRAAGEPQFDILVVDNAPSDDRTQAVVATFPSVGYAQEPRAGLDFARNCALHTATTGWLAFLDDDVTVDRQWFQGWQEAWAENPDAGAITGLVLPYELETPAQILFERRGGFGRGFEKIRYSQVLPNNPLYPCGAGMFGAGCNMAFRRQVLLELGGFDEALDTGKPLPGGGDLDMFYRVVRAGHPLVYEPQYAVYHQHRWDISQLRHQYWTWGLGFMAFVTKSIQSDPAMGSRFYRLMVWWLQDQLWQLQQSVIGRHVLPPPMILAELWGGLVGSVGEYQRSLRRVEAIRRQSP